jgi:uncharacterized membrane protein
MSRKNTERELQRQPDAGEGTPDEIALSRTEWSLHVGPLPPPEQLAKYNMVVEDGADRIFTIFEEQARHRMTLEKTHLDSGLRFRARGQAAAFAIGIFGLGVCLWLGLAGHDWLAGTVGVVDIAGLAGLFIYGRAEQKDERAKKAQVMAGADPAMPTRRGC